ncbi:MAG: hypothetical protein ACO3RV_01780 [Luteolibacter sp.]
MGIDKGFDFKGVLEAELQLSSIYDSNVFLSEAQRHEGLQIEMQPNLRYVSDPEGGATAAVIARYDPVYRVFLDRSELNHMDHDAELEWTIRGRLTELSLSAGYKEVTGSDRFTGKYDTGSLASGGLLLLRQIGSRSTLHMGFNHAHSDYDAESISGAQTIRMFIGGLWQPSSRSVVGATLRHTQSDSDFAGGRDSWSGLLELRYRLASRLAFSATFGPEWVDYSSVNQDSSLRWQAAIECRYQINERWIWSNHLHTAQIPSPDTLGYWIDHNSLTSQIEWKTNRGILTGGIEISHARYERVDPVSPLRSDENYHAVFIGFSRPIWNDRCRFESLCRRAWNHGVSDWEQWQVSAGIRISF